MLLVKTFYILTAYGMYQECCLGSLDPDWQIDEKEVMSLHDFHQELSVQMLQYHPSRLLYDGDSNMRS